MKSSEKLSARPMCILIAEDDSDMRVFLANTLGRDGYEVLEIASADELLGFLANHASNVAQKNDPGIDLIVSDIAMPGKTSLDVLEELRRVVDKVPIVLITAFGDKETIEKAMCLGATAVFDKPFDIGEFKAFLTSLTEPQPVVAGVDGPC
jgi:DNA-binding response OmpR family regulator